MPKLFLFRLLEFKWGLPRVTTFTALRHWRTKLIKQIIRHFTSIFFISIFLTSILHICICLQIISLSISVWFFHECFMAQWVLSHKNSTRVLFINVLNFFNDTPVVTQPFFLFICLFAFCFLYCLFVFRDCNDTHARIQKSFSICWANVGTWFSGTLDKPLFNGL